MNTHRLVVLFTLSLLSCSAANPALREYWHRPTGRILNLSLGSPAVTTSSTFAPGWLSISNAGAGGGYNTGGASALSEVTNYIPSINSGQSNYNNPASTGPILGQLLPDWLVLSSGVAGHCTPGGTIDIITGLNCGQNYFPTSVGSPAAGQYQQGWTSANNGAVGGYYKPLDVGVDYLSNLSSGQNHYYNPVGGVLGPYIPDLGGPTLSSSSGSNLNIIPTAGGSAAWNLSGAGIGCHSADVASDTAKPENKPNVINGKKE